MKPIVFNYQEHERVVEENKKLKAEVANLQIRCRIAESEKPDRDCKNCKHHKADGCSRWDCEYEPVKSDLISRQDAIDALGEEPEIWNDTEEEWAYRNAWVEHISAINALPSAEPKTGEWVKVIDEETSNVTKWHYECDQCRTGRYENGQRYCHNCGAKMRGEEE